MSTPTKNIEKLNQLLVDFNIQIKVDAKDYLDEYQSVKAVEFRIRGKVFNLYVDDEYDDFVYNNPILNLCIVLRDLEDYQFSTDYLVWCTERHIHPENEKARQFYMDLAQIYREIEMSLGEINSHIPNSDFEFSMREVQLLRQNTY